MFHHPIFSAEINYLVNSVNYPKLCRKLLGSGQGVEGRLGGWVLGEGRFCLINAASKLIGKFADVMTRFWLVMILKITRNHVTTSSSRQMFCFGEQKHFIININTISDMDIEMYIYNCDG